MIAGAVEGDPYGDNVSDDDADMNSKSPTPFTGLGSSVVFLRNGARVLGQALDAFHAA